MLDRIRLEPSRFVLHLAVFIIVALWTLPTAGLLVSFAARQEPDRGLGLVDGADNERPQRAGPHEGRCRPGREGRQLRHRRQSSSRARTARAPSAPSASSVQKPDEFPAGVDR